jgi:hypothetical protein
MSAGTLTPTEALLAQAAAVTPAEVHAARLSLIATAGAMTRELDTTLLVAGDGRAGNTLLGGPRRAAHFQTRSSCAIRSCTLLRRDPDPDEQRPIGGER